MDSLNAKFQLQNGDLHIQLLPSPNPKKDLYTWTKTFHELSWNLELTLSNQRSNRTSCHWLRIAKRLTICNHETNIIHMSKQDLHINIPDQLWTKEFTIFSWKGTASFQSHELIHGIAKHYVQFSTNQRSRLQTVWTMNKTLIL
jgi:hypothetical protein